MLVRRPAVAAQVRPERAVPLPAEMALNPILGRVIRQLAKRRIKRRPILQRSDRAHPQPIKPLSVSP
jgi:hypothetical protein